MSCAVLSLAVSAGCQGCRQNPETEDESQRPKEAFDFEKLAALPDLESPANQAKPGHWVSGHRKITANDYDFQGSLENRVIDSSGRPIPTEMTNHYLTTQRPVSLPKGQTKDVEVMYYIPRRLEGENRIVTLEQELFDRTGGKVDVPNGGVNLMPSYRYFFVVLSQSPGSFNFVKALPAMVMPNLGQRIELFRVVIPTIKDYVPVPSDSSAWTSFAFLLWDDLDPDMLTPKQQQALVDWLHFGGQIIVSGSTNMALLNRSFLGPYLPATYTGSRNFTDEDIKELSDFWTISPEKEPAVPWAIGDTGEVLGNDLELTAKGQWMAHSNELLAESTVGRGRIVVSSLPLNHRSLLRWPSYDSFFNNALLRRPRREFFSGTDSFNQDLGFHYTDFRGYEFDPRFFSTLRYLTRDLGFRTQDLESRQRQMEGEERPDLQTSDNPFVSDASTVASGAEMKKSERWHLGGYRFTSLSGVAGWNDSSAVARESQSVLDASAGIEPPSSQFVLTALGIYLLLLVPINWGVFRLIGRVEWAWIAAPILSILAAVGIVRTAQLDIGFARSQTELSILELQNGYTRGHMTRYASVYTSLSTEFSVDFDNDGARGQPWGSPMESRALSRANAREVQLSQEGGLQLKNVLVNSNSAELVHLEQMIDVGGDFALSGSVETGYRLVNATNLKLKDVGVYGYEPSGEMRKAWVGELAGNTNIELEWEDPSESTLLFQQWESNPITRSVAYDASEFLTSLDADESGTLSLKEMKQHPAYLPDWDRLFVVAQGVGRREASSRRDRGELDLQDVRKMIDLFPKEDLWLGGLLQLVTQQLVDRQQSSIMIGWADEDLPGTEWSPQPSQVNRRMLVVAHLDSLPWNPILPDVNLLTEVEDGKFEFELEDDEDENTDENTEEATNPAVGNAEND